jgi:hypothetical protein
MRSAFTGTGLCIRMLLFTLLTHSKLTGSAMSSHPQLTETRLRAQQAKEFLISRITEEAEEEKMPLSEIERKMLYFTENGTMPQEIYDVNNQFESQYDTSDYERKISGLLRNGRRRACRESKTAKTRWKQAIVDLGKEDHYLMVMVTQSLRSDHDTLSLIASGFAVCIGLLALMSFWFHLDERGLIPEWVHRLSLRLVVLAVIATIFVIKLVRLGLLGEILAYSLHLQKKRPEN